MRKLILILTLIVLIALVLTLSPSPTRAQNDPATVWYWATTPEGLVAYTADGEINLLLEDSEINGYSLLRAYRFAPNIALLSDNSHFYLVTDDSVHRFMIDAFFASSNFDVVDFRLPYVLFSSSEVLQASAIVNVETFETIPLSGHAVLPHFLPDGKTLRYINYDREETHIVGNTLWELNLVTGRQTQLHHHQSQANAMYSTPDGVQWWFVYDFMVDDPTSAKVVTIGDPNPQYTQWITDGTAYIFGEWLFHNLPCPGKCVTDIVSLTSTTPLQYQISGTEYLPRSIHHFADDSIWLSSASEAVLQDSSGRIFELGSIQLDGPVFSTDGRWAVAFDPISWSSLRIWYLPYRTILAEVPDVGWFYSSVEFFENTVLVRKEKSPYAVVWKDFDSPSGGSYVILPDYYPGTFFQPISDGNLLYQAPEGGIYRYSPSENTLFELVADGKSIKELDSND